MHFIGGTATVRSFALLESLEQDVVGRAILLCKVYCGKNLVQWRLMMCVVAFADVYERLTPRGKKATFKTLLVTQLVSGIWHGLFAGYVLFFASSAFLFESAKVIYRYEQGLGRRWDFLRTFPPLLFIKFLYTGFVLNYSAIAFLVSLSAIVDLRPLCCVLCQMHGLHEQTRCGSFIARMLALRGITEQGQDICMSGSIILCM